MAPEARAEKSCKTIKNFNLINNSSKGAISFEKTYSYEGRVIPSKIAKAVVYEFRSGKWLMPGELHVL